MARASPRLTALARGGLRLSNHLAHYHCSPSRRSFLSGRWPIHVGEQRSIVHSDDIDLRWALISDKLRAAGYATHWVGKADTGFRSMAHLPTRRGFDSFTGFLGGSQSYTSADRWADEGPMSADRRYSTTLYGERALELVREHDAARRPLFLYLAWQAVHEPYDHVPGHNCSTTAYKPYPGTYAFMLFEADRYTGMLVDALKAKGMWNNTLFVYRPV